MTWLWVILIVAVIGGIVGYFSSNSDRIKNAKEGFLAGGLGCGYIILQIFLAILGIYLLFRIGSCLFS